MSEEKTLLSEENQKLHRSNLDLAQANIELLSLLEKEKSKIPVKGKNFYGLIFAGLATVGGQLLPVDLVEVLGIKFHSNFVQVIGGIILTILLVGPYFLQLVHAIKGNKTGGQNDVSL